MKEKYKNINYKNIQLFYSNNTSEAKEIILYLKYNNYNFINYTPSVFSDKTLDEFKCISKNNTHEVIG